MTKLLKNKLFIGGASLAVVIAILLISAALKPSKIPVDNVSQTSSAAEATVTVPDISMPPDSQSGVAGTDEESSSDLVLDVDGKTRSDASKSSGNAAPPNKPVTENPPKETSNSGGIQIGGGESSTVKYSCGSPNHHCNGPETHAFILNLEQEGCSYCGSHSCPSFYTMDKWGNAWPDSTKCPQYNILKDPIRYCQTCGKKNGDGSNSTCVQFVNACNCPNCGKYVAANTCHTCE